MKLILSPKSAVSVLGAPDKLQRRLRRCLGQICETPRRHPNIRPLKGKLKGAWRYRLGEWRIVYEIDDSTGTVK